jgi:hypothetical protein
MAVGIPDVVVRMPEPYTVPADGTDVFRTFVIPIPVAAPRYVRALEFRPGNASVVHHANLGVDRTRSSRQLDARDPEPGYSGSMERDARYPEGQLLGWTPAGIRHAPAAVTPRAGKRPGHAAPLSADGEAEPVQVTVGFYFTDTPTSARACGWAARRSTFHPARAIVITDSYVLPVDVEVLAASHTRTTWRGAWKSTPASRMADAPAHVDRDQDSGGRTSIVHQPVRAAEGTQISMRYRATTG